jgi:hypothetical protein
VTTADPNKPTRNDRLRKIASGVEKNYPSGAMTLGAKTYAMPGDIVKPIEQDIQATDEATAAHAEWLRKVQVQRDSHKALDPVLRLLKKRVVSEAGDSQTATTTLAEYGWTPTKHVKKTVKTKSLAVAKALGTRKLRNTMSDKQKKQVKSTGLPGEASGTAAAPNGGAAPAAGATPAKPTT